MWVLARMLSAFMIPDAAEPHETLVAMAALKGPLARMSPQVTLEFLPIEKHFLTCETGMRYHDLRV